MKTYDAEIRVVRNDEGKSPGPNGGLSGTPLPNDFCFLVSRTDGGIIEPAFSFMSANYLTRAAAPSIKGSKNTVSAVLADLADLHHYLDAYAIKVADLSVKSLRGYATDLRHSKSAATGKNLAARTINRRWSTLTAFVIYCLRHGHLKNAIPTATRETKRGTTLCLDIDADIPGVDGGDRLIAAIDPETLKGVFSELGPPVIEVLEQRVVVCQKTTTDRLMAEICLHTGLRRAEVCNLNVSVLRKSPHVQLDPLSKLPVAVVGKGNKRRNVPFPVWLIDALDIYAKTTRMHVMEKRNLQNSEPDHGYIFVHELGNRRYLGNRISAQTFDRRFAVAKEKYLVKLGRLESDALYRMALTERVTVHALRHTFAIITYITRRNSGDSHPSKYVAAILGHKSVETTEQIYLNSAEAYDSKVRERIRIIHEQLPHMRLGASR